MYTVSFWRTCGERAGKRHPRGVSATPNQTGQHGLSIATSIAPPAATAMPAPRTQSADAPLALPLRPAVPAPPRWRCANHAPGAQGGFGYLWEGCARATGVARRTKGPSGCSTEGPSLRRAMGLALERAGTRSRAVLKGALSAHLPSLDSLQVGDNTRGVFEALKADRTTSPDRTHPLPSSV